MNHLAFTAVPGKARAAALYLVLTVVLTYPFSLHPASTISNDAPDDHLFMWTLAWNAHAFLHQPLSIFDANMMFPNHNTLAYSENLLGSALITAPVLWLTNNPVLAVNIVSLLSCILCGLGAYVLGRRVGLSGPAALLAGVIFAFTPPRFFRFSQLHLTVVQWIPFCLASLHAYLDGGRRRDLLLAIAFFSLQTLSTGHGAVFLVEAITILFAYRLAMGEPIRPVRRIEDLGLIGVLLVLPLVGLFLPYRTAQTEVGLIRGLGSWDTKLASFWASPTYVHAWLLQHLATFDVNGAANAFLFPGYIPLLLALILIVIRRDERRPARAREARSAPPRSVWSALAFLVNACAALAMLIALAVEFGGPLRLRVGSLTVLTARSAFRAWVVVVLLVIARGALTRYVSFEPLTRARAWRAAWMSWGEAKRSNPLPVYLGIWLISCAIALGPPISLWPYIYSWPVLNFIRVPSRFTIVGVLGLAIVAGLGFDRWSRRWTTVRAQRVAMVVGALLVVEFAGMPLWHVPYRIDTPAADRWLAEQPKPFAIAEVPARSDRDHSLFMLHSMVHWQKTVNGYAGVISPIHDGLFREMRRFPDADSVRHLAELGVNYVVVHVSWYAPDERGRLEEGLERFAPWLTLQYSDQDARVYSLHEPETAVGPR